MVKYFPNLGNINCCTSFLTDILYIFTLLDELQVSSGALKSFPDTIIVCLLKAIKMENMAARQRFPRLLQLVEMYPDTMTTFVAKVGFFEVIQHKCHFVTV